MHNHCINNLLNLKGVIIKKINNSDNNVFIHIETNKSIQSCPHCNSSTSKIKDYRFQLIKDSPIQFKHTFLLLKKRRYLCSNCGKSFYESYHFLPKYYRTTNRLTSYIYNQLCFLKTQEQIALEANVSSYKVGRIIDLFHSSNSTLPEVLSIDEFKGNTGSYKYQVSLIDSKNHKILDILPCRYKHELCQYFKSFSIKERSKVKYFITDLWETYKDIAMTYFPNAKIIADRFHFSRYIISALNNVRKETQKKLSKKDRKYFFRSKKLLLARPQNLSPAQLERLNYILNNFSEDLRQTYLEKEYLLNIIHEKDSNLAISQFNDWIKRNLSCGIIELENCAKTFFNWSYEIKNSLEVPYSNGVIEGFNNKIKTLKRISFGLRNFERFRTRILLLN